MYILIDKAYKKNCIIINCTFLYKRFSEIKTNLLEEQFLLFEIDEENEDFRELIDIETFIHTLLVSSSIFLIIDSVDKKVWIWHGRNASIRKKFIATQNEANVRDRHGVDFKIVAVDEGGEPSEFKKIVVL